MVQLQKDFEQIEKANIRLAGISYDSPDVLKKFTEEIKIPFLLLSDPDSKAIDAYELRNKEARRGSRQDGIAHPVTVLVDADGVVRARLAYDVRKRHSTQELIDAAKKIRESRKD